MQSTNSLSRFGVVQPFNAGEIVDNPISIDYSAMDMYNRRHLRVIVESLLQDKNSAGDTEEILRRGDLFKEHLIQKTGACTIREGNSIPCSIDNYDLDIMLKNTNNINRDVVINTCIKYFEEMRDGKWNPNHLAGRRLEYSYYGYQMLSCQHRVVAMKMSLMFGLVDSWDVIIEFSDPMLWASKEGRDMSVADRSVIFENITRMREGSQQKLTQDQVKFMMAIRPRVYQAEDNKTGNSGMGSELKDQIPEYMIKYRESMNNFSTLMGEEGMPQFPDSSNIKKALGTLYLTGHLSVADMRTLKRQDSMLSSALTTLSREGFGMCGHNNLFYAIAIIKHASIITGINCYGNINDALRPNKYTKAHVYLFDNLQREF